MTGQALAFVTCADCKRRFTACLDCQPSVFIDPETGLPPDSVMGPDGKAVHNPNPDPAATARAYKHPVCDPCVRTRNRIRAAGGPGTEHMTGEWETGEARHRRAHA